MIQLTVAAIALLAVLALAACSNIQWMPPEQAEPQVAETQGR